MSDNVIHRIVNVRASDCLKNNYTLLYREKCI